MKKTDGNGDDENGTLSTNNTNNTNNKTDTFRIFFLLQLVEIRACDSKVNHVDPKVSHSFMKFVSGGYRARYNELLDSFSNLGNSLSSLKLGQETIT
jgi:hypothetical protein